MKNFLFLLLLSIAGELHAQITLENDKVKNIPNGYRVEYLAKDTSRKYETYYYYYLVLSPTKEPLSVYTRDFRVFSGWGDQQLIETEVYQVERFKDGGSTIIQTVKGVLYFPAAGISGIKGNGGYLSTPKFNMFDDLVRII